MKCFHCGDDLRWNNDFDTEDDDQYLIVSMYECMNDKCKAWYEIYHGLKEKETVN
jgi:hypothetical protein